MSWRGNDRSEPRLDGLKHEPRGGFFLPRGSIHEGGNRHTIIGCHRHRQCSPPSSASVPVTLRDIHRSFTIHSSLSQSQRENWYSVRWTRTCQVVELRLSYRYAKQHPWVVQAVTGFLCLFMDQPGFRVQRHLISLACMCAAVLRRPRRYTAVASLSGPARLSSHGSFCDRRRLPHCD